MFDMNSMKKLTDEVPDEMKEELKKRAMEKLGLSNSEGGNHSEEAAAPSAQVVDQADGSTDTQVNAADQTQSTDAADQTQSTDDDKADAA